MSTWKTRAAERFKRICEGLFDRALPVFGVAFGSMYEVELVPCSTSATKLSAASARSRSTPINIRRRQRLSRSWQPCDRSALVARPIRRVLHLDKLATTPLDGFSLLTNRMHLALSRPTQSSSVCRSCKMPRSRKHRRPRGADRRPPRGTAVASYLPVGSVVSRRGDVRYSQHATIMVHSGRRRHRWRLRFVLSLNL